MKGKINLKTIIITGIGLLVVVLLVLGVGVARNFISGAAAGYEPQDLVATPKEDAKSATISWTSDKSVKASVFYGTNMASLLLMAEDVEPTSNHNILLTNLRSNTTYFYKIVVDNNNVFDNGGSMFSFKTGESIASTEESTKQNAEQLEPSISIAPTVVLTPAPVASSSTTSDGSTCNKTTDYNGDKTINSLDYLSCLKGKITPTVVDKCAGDYNKDGIVNSLDRIKCLQETKR